MHRLTLLSNLFVSTIGVSGLPSSPAAATSCKEQSLDEMFFLLGDSPWFLTIIQVSCPLLLRRSPWQGPPRSPPRWCRRTLATEDSLFPLHLSPPPQILRKNNCQTLQYVVMFWQLSS